VKLPASSGAATEPEDDLLGGHESPTAVSTAGRQRLTVPGFPYITSTPLLCYESPVYLASSQRSSLRSYVLTLCYLLGAFHSLSFSCHRLWRLRRLEAFPEENLFRDCLVKLHNAALNLWR
jgi:hypothetical protein